MCDAIHIARLTRQIEELQNQLAEASQRNLMQLAAITTAVGMNTRESSKQRITRDSPWFTHAYSEVCRAIDREIALRESLPGAPDILVRYQGKDGRREWQSVGAWLMPGQAIAVVDV